MTPKEKCDELFDKYSILIDTTGAGWNKDCSKQCALIAVAEILYELTELPYGLEYLWRIDYWTAVEQEIKNI